LHDNEKQDKKKSRDADNIGYPCDEESGYSLPDCPAMVFVDQIYFRQLPGLGRQDHIDYIMKTDRGKEIPYWYFSVQKEIEPCRSKKNNIRYTGENLLPG
jgi:hypothetical protein